MRLGTPIQFDPVLTSRSRGTSNLFSLDNVHAGKELLFFITKNPIKLEFLSPSASRPEFPEASGGVANGDRHLRGSSVSGGGLRWWHGLCLHPCS